MYMSKNRSRWKFLTKNNYLFILNLSIYYHTINKLKIKTTASHFFKGGSKAFNPLMGFLLKNVNNP